MFFCHLFDTVLYFLIHQPTFFVGYFDSFRYVNLWNFYLCWRSVYSYTCMGNTLWTPLQLILNRQIISSSFLLHSNSSLKIRLQSIRSCFHNFISKWNTFLFQHWYRCLLMNNFLTKPTFDIRNWILSNKSLNFIRFVILDVSTICLFIRF